MSGTPDVTVVIPSKDRPDVIGRALRSCFEPPGLAVEVVVVTDGSTARAVAQYEEIVGAFAGARLLHQDAARGPGGARNRGIEAATGRYLAVLDDDNIFLPGMLASQHASVAGADDVIAVCGVEIVKPNGARTMERPSAMAPRSLNEEADPFAIVPPRAFWPTFYAPTRLIRDAGGYDATLLFGEHTELFLRLLDRARFTTRPDIGARVHRRYGLSHASREWERKAEATQRIMELHADRFERMPGVKARWMDVLGMTYLRLGRRSEARRAFAASVRIQPSARAFAHLVGATTGALRVFAPGAADASAV